MEVLFKLLERFLTSSYKKVYLTLWFVVAAVSFLFVEGYLGWWVLCFWLFITAICKIYATRMKQSGYIKVDDGEEPNADKHINQLFLFSDNRVNKILFFYLAQFIPFAIVLELSEIEWWMYLGWGISSVFFSFFFNRFGFTSPFRESNN